ncbi:MAG: diguanylate cyclase [Holophagae bacterium]|jgi:diguanylate cyclase (GGDEF)-like protein
MASDEGQADPRDRLDDELQRLRSNFADKLPLRLEEMTAQWLDLFVGPWSEEEARGLHRKLHGLIGTAGSLGFPAVARTTRKLEQRLLSILDTKAPPTDHENRAVLNGFERIGAAAIEDEGRELHTKLDVETPPEARIFEERNLIVVVETEGPFAHELAYQLGYFGFDLQMYRRIDELVASSVARKPAAVIMDLSAQAEEPPAVEVASVIRTGFGDQVPLIFVSNRSDMEARLDAVRAGCSAFFVKPVNYANVLATLDRLTRMEPEPYRILIIDDEKESAEYHSVQLEAAGMKTIILTDPLLVISHLVEFQPDVVLLDLYMPECSGLELAAVIRQEEAFVGVPIVFLSVEQDRMKQIAALGEGGDDFFTKPVPPEQLVRAITARAHRGRTLRMFMERDGLTGLYSHSRFIEQLEVAVSRSGRSKAKLAVAMIDIDGFKEVNDTHGHLVGDQVLKALAYLLRQRLRISDVLGRFGGDEYIVVLGDTDGAAAVGKMNDIRRNFAAVEHDTGEGCFSVTLSCGVAEFPAHLTGHELIAAADEALYQAKRAGRNRVVKAEAGEDRE